MLLLYRQIPCKSSTKNRSAATTMLDSGLATSSSVQAQHSTCCKSITLALLCCCCCCLHRRRHKICNEKLSASSCVSLSCVKFSNYKKRKMKTSRTTHCAVAAVATLARLALNYANLITKPSASQPHTHTHTVPLGDK